MAVSLYLGLPGDGKSMSGVRKVVAVLTGGSRSVITNLPLEIGELESYLMREYGRTCDVRNRVVLLRQEQVRKFWLVRAAGWCLVDLPDDAWATNQFPSLNAVYRYRPGGPADKRKPIEGMTPDQVSALVETEEVETGDLGSLHLEAVFIIDECQNFWPARSFQSTPKGLLFYLSQHRHVGDDCVFITQKESQVEKVVRNLVMEFWIFRNLGQRKRLGFRMPNVFGYACYDIPPSTQGAQYSTVGHFRMDVKGLAACYRTADGVGVGGPTMEADSGRKRRDGFSWKWVLVGVGLTMWLAVKAPEWLGRLGWNAVENMQAKIGVPTNMPPALAQSVAVPVVSVASNSASPLSVSVVTQAVVESKPVVKVAARPSVLSNLFLVGELRGESGRYFMLSDGQMLTEFEVVAVVPPNGPVQRILLPDGWVTWGRSGSASRIDARK